jgi:uncharacterized glyoxalase superfamily protein PhnB
VITGAHVILHTPQAEALRGVFRDVLHWEHVDGGEGWLIFALPPAELGIHPSDGDTSHALHFMCDDLEQTVEELRGKGLEVQGPPRDHEWGTATTLVLPGGVEVTLYEPKHPLAAPPNLTYETR